jgi:hypothetical protein
MRTRTNFCAKAAQQKTAPSMQGDRAGAIQSKPDEIPCRAGKLVASAQTSFNVSMGSHSFSKKSQAGSQSQ